MLRLVVVLSDFQRPWRFDPYVDVFRESVDQAEAL
jgi:hypothetical protein